MIINNTTEVIEFFLGGTVTSQQASFLCSFNELSATTITPLETNGLSNNTTAVTLMGSPSSGLQRQLRQLSIKNNDTSNMTITIRFNDGSNTRILYKPTLQPGDQIFYSELDGWTVMDSFGQKELSTVHVVQKGGIRPFEMYYNNAAAGTVTLANSNYPIISICKAEKNYSSITLSYRITTAAATITFCELAIYRVAQPMGVGTQQALQRLGFVDTSGVWNSLGNKTTTITLTGCKKGDDLYAVFASQSTTTPVFRSAGAYADPLSSVLRCVNTSGTSWRPSLNEMFLAVSFSNANASINFSWKTH